MRTGPAIALALLIGLMLGGIGMVSLPFLAFRTSAYQGTVVPGVFNGTWSTPIQTMVPMGTTTHNILPTLSGLALFVIVLVLSLSAHKQRAENPLASLITRLFFMALMPALVIAAVMYAGAKETSDILLIGFICTVVTFVFLTVSCMFLARAGHPLRRDQEAQPPALTTQLSQELYRQAQAMEERLEALETILLEKSGRTLAYDKADRRRD